MKTILSEYATALMLAADWMVSALCAELEKNPAMPQDQQVEFLRKRFRVGSAAARTLVTYTHL